MRVCGIRVCGGLGARFVLTLCTLGGCGPAVATPPGEVVTSEASGTGGSDEGDTTAASSAATSAGAASTSAEADTSSDSTGPSLGTGSISSTGPRIAPSDILGEWLCLGERIPFFLRIDRMQGSDLSGSACAPSDPQAEPHQWGDCSGLGDHPPSGFAYHVLASFGSPDGGYELEFGFNHDRQTDSLLGARFPAEPPIVLEEQTCERYSQ